MSDTPCGVDSREAVISILVLVDDTMLINPGGQLNVSVDVIGPRLLFIALIYQTLMTSMTAAINDTLS